MLDQSAILADTAAYGFVFVMDEIRTDKGDTSLGNGPILTVTNPALFESHFPGRIAAMLDGSSARVISQRVDRAVLVNTRLPEDTRLAVLGPKVLNAILGVKTRGAPVLITEKVFELPDGSTTKDKAEFMAAWGIN